jgi:hypothetical protein
MQAAVQQEGNPRVVIGSAAFAQEDRFSIVPAELFDESGLNSGSASLHSFEPAKPDSALPRDGRIRGVPESYRLTKEGERCVMTRERDGKAVQLTACRCEVLK